MDRRYSVRGPKGPTYFESLGIHASWHLAKRVGKSTLTPGRCYGAHWFALALSSSSYKAFFFASVINMIQCLISYTW